MSLIYPWFELAADNLQAAYASERLAHGLLLNAPVGSGKKTFALALAQSLLCKQSKMLASPCHQCKSCLLFTANSHPDFYLIEPLLDTKGNRKKSIGIDQIRSLSAKLVDSAQLDGWRVAMISSVAIMTRASFNALLKSLEEPGDKVLLLLLTNSLAKVPATVRSRCQIVAPDLSHAKLIPWLTAQSQRAESDIRLALSACQSAPLATQAFLKENGADRQLKLFGLLDKVLAAQLSPADFIAQCEVADEQLADLLANYFYQLKLLSISSATPPQRYRGVADKWVFQMYAKVLDYNRAQDSGSNLQTKLQLTAILTQWFEIGRKISHYSSA